MIFVRTFLIAAAAALPLTGQKRDGVEAFVDGLAAQATWERDAAKLVLAGRRAAKPLAERLRKIGKDEKQKEHAKRILLVLERLGLDGSAAVESLWSVIHEMPKQNVGHALLAIGQVTPPGGPHRTEEKQKLMMRMLSNINLFEHIHCDHYMKQREWCFGVLHDKAGFDADVSIPELHRLLRTDLHRTYLRTCQVLARRGRKAKETAPTMAAFLRTHCAPRKKEEPGRLHSGHSAALAILAIDPASEHAAVALGYLLLREPFRDLRMRAARELMLLGAHVEHAVPMLVEFLKREKKDGELLRLVMNLLTMAGRNAEKAIPQLQKLATSKDAKTATRAKAVLARLRKR